MGDTCTFILSYATFLRAWQSCTDHHQSCHTGGVKPFSLPYEKRYLSRRFGKVFSRKSRPALGPAEVFSPEVKRHGHEVDHSPPTRDEVMNEWNCISIPPPYAFKAWKGTTSTYHFLLERVLACPKTPVFQSFTKMLPCQYFSNF